MCYRSRDCRVCGREINRLSRYGYCSMNCSLKGRATLNLVLAIIFFLAMCIGLMFAYSRSDLSYFDAVGFLIAMGIFSALMSGLSVVGYNLRRAEGY